MTATGDIRIGIAEAGIRHDMSRPPELATQFQLVKECGVFDYLDKTPPRAQQAEYARLSERFDLPILAGGWWYTLGRDEDLLAENIRIGAELGSLVHNVQIMMVTRTGIWSPIRRSPTRTCDPTTLAQLCAACRPSKYTSTCGQRIFAALPGWRH